MNGTLGKVMGVGSTGTALVLAGVVAYLVAGPKPVLPPDCSKTGVHCVKVWVRAATPAAPITVMVDARTIYNQAGRFQAIYWFIDAFQSLGYSFAPNAIVFTNGQNEFTCIQAATPAVNMVECDDPQANASPQPDGFKYNITLINGAGDNIATKDPYVVNN